MSRRRVRTLRQIGPCMRAVLGVEVATVAAVAAVAALLAGCGSSPSTAPPSTAHGGAAPTSGAATSSAAAGAAGAVPTSCSTIPVTLIGADIGGVAKTLSLGKPPSLSCEFANAAATSVVVVNLGVGSASQFAVLKAASAGGGRTIAPVTGLGTSAFSISKGAVPRGVDAITAQNLIVSVGANLPLAETEAIVGQMISLC